MRTVAEIGRILGCCLLLATSTWLPSASAAETGFLTRTYSDADGAHRYVVYVPAAYSSASRWPVVLYLHGAGFSGRDGQRHLTGGLASVIRAEGDYPAIVVFPQCEDVDSPLLTRWLALAPDGRRALKILEEVEREFAVDGSRRVVAGWSMGGYGAWSLAAAEPDRWSAVVAVSGGGDPELGRHIIAPVWAIHGAADRAIPAEQSRVFVEAVTRAGGQAALTELPGVAHDAWRYAFSAPSVRAWMFAASGQAPDTSRLAQEAAEYAATGRAEALDGEFRPALTIPRAVSVRIGNDALETLAYGAPAAVDPRMLQGRLDDLAFDFTAAGEAFRITQTDVGFNVALHRVLIETQSSGVLRLRVGLQPLTITIGATHVHSTTRTADAGPIAIRLGHRFPLWIDLTLRPTVSEGRLKLQIERTGFDIADANWVVTAPDAVTVTGPDLTPELVRTALVGGLYTRREEIAAYIRDFLPQLVERLEDRLQPTSVDRIVASIWPMPVFRPRLRLHPEEVSVDGDGLSLVLGLAAAPFSEAQRPAQPVVTQPMGPRAVDMPHSRALELGIAPGVLQALSGMIVDAQAARIDVRDMPEPEFALLGSRGELNRILPQLAAYGAEIEVRTELNLAAPFVVQRSELVDAVQFTSTANNPLSGEESAALPRPDNHPVTALAAQFEIPRLIVSVFIRERSASPDWRPYATFDVRLVHSASLRLTCDEREHCTAELAWTGAPAVAVAGGYVGASEFDAAIDRPRLAQLVEACWAAWTGTGNVLHEEVPDLVLGTAHLRIDSIDWRDVELVARYRTPDIRITNSGSRLVDYAVRGQYSDWSRRRQLKPGETEVYSGPSSLFVRRYPEPAESAIAVPVGGELDLATMSQ